MADTPEPNRPGDERARERRRVRVPRAPSRRVLTPMQRDILASIEAHADARGYPPSVREIGEMVGLSSPSSVHVQLLQLDVAGYLQRDRSIVRGIKLHHSDVRREP